MLCAPVPESWPPFWVSALTETWAGAARVDGSEVAGLRARWEPPSPTARTGDGEIDPIRARKAKVASRRRRDVRGGESIAWDPAPYRRRHGREGTGDQAQHKEGAGKVSIGRRDYCGSGKWVTHNKSLE